ncbi:DEAD/DEAH box helicase [Saccharopolyspora pogona]|uniref:DEAD/DEAH box helicase n=1 Tax=Saccharopolyspora pogona TaxID=333966 RepID=UPI001683E1DA|nr:DEAD/DEAH box helicase [Saccharopolyspora pogona]
MRPTLEAQGLKESLLQYLSTTYALSDEGAREALHWFLGDETTGMFRGPFVRLRVPFRQASNDWERLLAWKPSDFRPYAHQSAAFQRLTSIDGHEPQPTIITTGTGSGKTEAFLYPILDHCARERVANPDAAPGIKAVLLYPMNALATDQAKRIEDLLKSESALSGVTAGLYIGEEPASGYRHVVTHKPAMRHSPPDILLTNYKMLDLLLQRGEDVRLWANADLRYVVVDEFHTYDGAQGTDVAMLLRRLASVVGAVEPGKPLGRICPIATSATLSSPGATTDAGTATAIGEQDRNGIVAVATALFGTEFSPDAVIGEERMTVDEFLPSDAFKPVAPPEPDVVAALPDPTTGDAALIQLIEAFTGDAPATIDPHELGAELRRLPFTTAVLRAASGEVRTYADVLDQLWRVGGQSWIAAITHTPEVAAQALARFIALLSIARHPDSTPDNPRPFVQVEVHQWARSVSRIVRGVLPWPRAEFRWDNTETIDASGHGPVRTSPTTATVGATANLFLPAIYCRSCGRSGWAVFSPESDPLAIQLDAQRIRRASMGRDKMRVRNLIAATDAEAREGAATTAMSRSKRESRRGATSRGAGGQLYVLDGAGSQLRVPNPGGDYEREADNTPVPSLPKPDSAFVLAHLGDTADTAAREDWCPACGEHNAIRFLGTGSAALASASITHLFTAGELDKSVHEDKLLMFSDSVQDAAHRAGFVSSRSYTFSLRALLASHLSDDAPKALNDLIADVITNTTDPETLRAVVPTDLHDLRGVNRLLSGKGRGGDLPTWELIGQRLAFETLMEFGFRSRNGRTLELTRTAAAHVHLPDPDAAVETVRAALAESVADGPAQLVGPDTDTGAGEAEPDTDAGEAESGAKVSKELAFLRVFLERLRTRGAVKHEWLVGYLRESGTNRYQIWGRRPQGMRAFPKHVAAPKFLLAAPKNKSDFDIATGRLSWHERWAQRCLKIPREQVPGFWRRLLPALTEAGLLSVGTPTDTSVRIYGLQPGAVSVRLLRDDEVRHAFVRCNRCSWEQTVPPSLLDQWHGQRCPSYRCSEGRLVAGDRAHELGVHLRHRDFREDYYRRLYRQAGTYQVVTAEHTGLLSRAERERVEQGFRAPTGFKNPNVLSCTPTLEMGIDIGELSSVVLAALPRRPSGYAQQVGRAGRKTGNAFLLTIPGRKNRDRYFLEQPKEMIAGRITPPGCHLSAIEILRRQYFAHLLDLAAHGRLKDPDGGTIAALPQRASALFGPSDYLVDLVDAVLADADTLVDGFLTLFPAGVTDEAKEQLRQFATRELRRAVGDAQDEWFRAEETLRRRLDMIKAARDRLHDSDPDDAKQKAELNADERAVRRSLRDRGRIDSQQALCDLGLTPNYALLDSVTELNATLYWEESEKDTENQQDKDRRVRFETLPRTYVRPRRYALEELAPGNTFYASGYKHEITGIEIGTPQDREWTAWRLCPECGHVRTSDAANDRSPCTRCGSPRISDDGSYLHQVVEPKRVTARDRREDARINDDTDDRIRESYTFVNAVDIDPQTISDSWRHAAETFGVDFSRNAVIRRINLGPARFDQRADARIAGRDVRISPFLVCTDCGAVSTDGAPVFHHPPDAQASSGRDPHLRHHRPWCRRRLGNHPDEVSQQPVLLAHELRTEALRVLLPASTMLVDQRVQSFKAALRLGVDRHYGGDPQHLDATLTSMPDSQTGERRHYLVLFDRLPSGTGYLHRLVEPDKFRDTLVESRRALLECPCADEGRRACHRCLHRHTEEQFQHLVSRQEALSILGDLLGSVDENGELVEDKWATDSVPSTSAIGLEKQLESDLEARFLAVLRSWASAEDNVALDEDSRVSGYLRFASTTDVVSWRLTAQRRTGYTRTDFTFERVDGPRQSVTVYLDGYRNHAAPDRNRIAGDADKRGRLRSDGHVVFQLTWDDLELFDEPAGKPEAVWPPYVQSGQNQARDLYEHLGGDRSDLDRTVFTNPMHTVLAFLREPDRNAWARRATALLNGLMGPSVKPLLQYGQPQDAITAIRAELTGRPPSFAGTESHWHVLRCTDSYGVDLLFVVDERGTVEESRWAALVVHDDSNTALADTRHRRRWRAWLYWSNLVQFLAYSGGDGAQIAASRAHEFAPETLAIFSGTDTHEQPVLTAAKDLVWDEEILPLLEEDEKDKEDEPESALTRLARCLAAAGKKAPEFGHELGEQNWEVDFGWRAVRIGATGSSSHSDEARKRDEAYGAEGWQVHTAEYWLDHLDSLLPLIPDVEGSTAR